MEIDGFLQANQSNLDVNFRAVYLWDPVTQQYMPVTLPAGNDKLAPGQGFFVKAAAGATGVTFHRSMQVHAISTVFKRSTIPWPFITLKASSGQMARSAKIVFNDQMTAGLDPGYDAGLLPSGSGFDLYTRLVADNSIDFSLQALPLLNDGSHSIAIGVDSRTGGEITFSAEMLNLPPAYDVMLEDRKEGVFTNLTNAGASYSTSVAVNSKGIGRFFLHAGKNLTTSIVTIEQNPLTVYTIDQTLYIRGEVTGKTQFAIFGIDGRMLVRFSAEDTHLNKVPVGNLPAGIYILRSSGGIQYDPVKFVIHAR
jgi:hypothetical protein